MTMRIGMVLAAIGLAFSLGGCDALMIDPFGYDTSSVQANGCTAASCPQAATFCANRGYSPGTDRYNRCMISVEENLRKGN